MTGLLPTSTLCPDVEARLHAETLAEDAAGAALAPPTIFGDEYLYFELATKVFRQWELLIPLEKYRISLQDDGATVVVQFVDREVTEIQGQGNPGEIPALVVVIEKDTFRVLSANFMR